MINDFGDNFPMKAYLVAEIFTDYKKMQLFFKCFVI